METFQKRQKEMRRLERQRDKVERRNQRKLNRANGIEDPSDASPDEISPDGALAVEPNSETAAEPIAKPAANV